MHGSERGSAILEPLAKQCARTSRHRGESDPQSGVCRWRLDANQALGLFVEPDRTGGCSAARPPAAARSMRSCTQETLMNHPQFARRSLGDKSVLAANGACGGRACALGPGIRCDCVALQRQPHVRSVQARRVRRFRLESNQGGCGKPPNICRVGACAHAAGGPGSDALRSRCDWQPRAEA